MDSFGKIFILAGVSLIIFGLMSSGKLGPFGHLPGDFSYHRGNFSFYFPLASGLLLGLILSVIIWLFSRR